jgi:tellurite resistance protein
VQPYLHFFFIPVFPVGRPTGYIECQRCGGTFDAHVLTRYPAERRAREMAEFVEFVKRVMVFTALADGRVDAPEVEAIRTMYGDLAGGTPLSRSDVERELNLGRLAKGGLADYPCRFPGRLSEAMKEEAIGAALAVARADGEVGPDEVQHLRDLAAQIGLAEGRLQQLMSAQSGVESDRGSGAAPASLRLEPAPGKPPARYVFAHQALPSIAFDNPGGFLGALSDSNPRRDALLRDLWREVVADCPWDTEAAGLNPEFLVHPFLLCGNCGILIELPEPQMTSEAFLAAVVVRLPRSAVATPSDRPPTWYFTLEKGEETLARMVELLSGHRESSRLAAAVRKDPGLLGRLLKEPMFRLCFYRDVAEKLLPDLAQEPWFRAIAPRLLKDPGGLADHTNALGLFLDEYDRRVVTPGPYTVLGGWTADGTHMNYGPGSRPNREDFLADLAVLFCSGPPGGLT